MGNKLVPFMRNRERLGLFAGLGNSDSLRYTIPLHLTKLSIRPNAAMRAAAKIIQANRQGRASGGLPIKSAVSSA